MQITLNQISPTAMHLENDQFSITVDRPIEKGGGGQGLMGGQYYLIGIGGCFCSTLFAAAQSRNVEISGLKVIIKPTMSEDLPKRFSEVALDVSYASCSNEAEFDKLLKIAEKGCLSINTAKQGMSVNIQNNIANDLLSETKT